MGGGKAVQTGTKECALLVFLNSNKFINIKIINNKNPKYYITWSLGPSDSMMCGAVRASCWWATP